MTVFLLKFALAIPGIRQLITRIYTIEDPELETEVFGLKFKNPVGLAAGFDKDGKYYKAMEPLGFGFIEIGTVTPLAQSGNPKPRLFRLPQDQALINRMGFNNEGIEAMVSRLKGRKDSKVIIGGNIGKNKLTPNEEATSDYIKCFHALYDHVDYFVVNVSSPNTPGLRELQEKEPLTQLLKTLQKERTGFTEYKPLLLKIAPDLNEGQIDDIIEIAISINLDGLIIANTTISRDGLLTSKDIISKIGNGGLSGKVMEEKSTKIIQYVYEKTRGELPIIGVGGIHSAQDALEKIDAGASLVQIYTGMVYEGPTLIRRINKAILKRFGK